jgi:hypothetical protein
MEGDCWWDGLGCGWFYIVHCALHKAKRIMPGPSAPLYGPIQSRFLTGNFLSSSLSQTGQKRAEEDSKAFVHLTQLTPAWKDVARDGIEEGRFQHGYVVFLSFYSLPVIALFNATCLSNLSSHGRSRNRTRLLCILQF